MREERREELPTFGQSTERGSSDHWGDEIQSYRSREKARNSQRVEWTPEGERGSNGSTELEGKLQESIAERIKAEERADDLARRILLLEKEQQRALKNIDGNQGKQATGKNEKSRSKNGLDKKEEELAAFKRERLKQEKNRQREKSAEAKRKMIESKKSNACLVKSLLSKDNEKASRARASEYYNKVQNFKKISKDERSQRSKRRTDSPSPGDVRN